MRTRRSRHWIFGIGILAVATTATAFMLPADTDEPRDLDPPAATQPTATQPTATQPPATVAPPVHDWPGLSENPPGVYSWDGGSGGNVGFMHNGYGSGDVTIMISVLPDPVSDGSASVVTVAGHVGIYRRIDAQHEEWIADIEGTTVAIRLDARPGTSPTDLADAHAIIESMRTELRDSDLGFRLVFTLTTDDWDSG